MSCNCIIPEKIKKILMSKNETIVYAQKSDLNKERQFGDSYLILTENRLIVSDNDDITRQIVLQNILEICIDELVGGGRITARTEYGVFHLLYYTNHQTQTFSKAAYLINDYLNGRKIVSAEIAEDTICKKCGAPLPERASNCPHCVPKFKILKRIISLANPYKKHVFLLLFVTALSVALQVLPPYFTKEIIDNVIGKNNKQNLIYYIAAMVSTGILYLIVRLAYIRLSTWISARIVTDLRSRLHTVLQYLKLGFFNRREPGELVGRIMHDTGELQQFLVDGLPFLIVNCFTFVVVGIIMININWKLTIAVLLPIPVLILGTGWFWKRLNPLFLREGTIIGHLHSVLSESINGLRAVKVCARENHRIKIFNEVNEDLARTRTTTQVVSGSFNETIFWIMSMGIALVWFFGVKMIDGNNGDFTLGELLAFVGYIWLFYGPLQWFSVVLDWMTQAFSGAERIFEVLDSSTEKYDKTSLVNVNKINGRIEFRNVRFSYERGKEILKGLTFDAAPGDVIGLVGRSGTGKSTIINLLIRFFEPDHGSIYIDGVALQKIDPAKLRSNIGVVMQEPFLFNASIAENIAYGLENISFSKIVNAARAAYAHEFIINKPNGYDTLIGDCGERLSGGEKQRIAIARAILQDPPILILDEATSSVDVCTEQHIQSAISNLIKGRTTIAIAHRLSTLSIADKLIVLSDGQVVESGTHDELLAYDGMYAEMVRSYNQINSLQSVVWGG